MSMPLIEFTDEAHDSWDRAVQNLRGYNVDLHLVDDEREHTYRMVGTAYDSDGWAVAVREVNDVCEPVGPQKLVPVDTIERIVVP